MTRRWIFLPFFVLCYLVVIIPFADYMRRRPLVERLGYTPRAEVLRAASGDQKTVLAAGLVLKALFYYGSLVDINQNKMIISPDFFALYKTIETAVQLDPYNMDAYYFGQAVMAWDVGRVQEANALLAYGMKYRTWDYYLPFFAGFNYSYFLKDYAKAAENYKKAAELSGVPLYANLAGRYLYESGQTDMARAYLAAMVKGAKNDSMRKEFALRLSAINEVKRIEVARDRYEKENGNKPASVEELLRAGFLAPPPVDPYGGRFYLDEQGKVKTTSEFSFFKGKTASQTRSSN